MLNSHRPTRRDKTVAFASAVWIGLDSPRLKTVADREYEVWTRSRHCPIQSRRRRKRGDSSGGRCEFGINWAQGTRICGLVALPPLEQVQLL